MCVVSMVLKAAQSVPIQQWTVPAWHDFQEVLEIVRRIDAKLGQPDCEDPKKEEWMKAVEERLSKLESLKTAKKPAKKAKPKKKKKI